MELSGLLFKELSGAVVLLLVSVNIAKSTAQLSGANVIGKRAPHIISEGGMTIRIKGQLWQEIRRSISGFPVTAHARCTFMLCFWEDHENRNEAPD
ncbi:hypothetical protein M514_11725 [Trichuris suis]|uniref:Secreted protein n=1 Tax=Trichuris suis TaxID=68888 RepID=A0A085LR18_9BILA|nr:hypothetical protein M513_11725 [Trichuris suis]KFD63036.1 hypothetical protein M514_11725 [Trichuris suis]